MSGKREERIVERMRPDTDPPKRAGSDKPKQRQKVAGKIAKRAIANIIVGKVAESVARISETFRKKEPVAEPETKVNRVAPPHPAEKALNFEKIDAQNAAGFGKNSLVTIEEQLKAQKSPTGLEEPQAFKPRVSFLQDALNVPKVDGEERQIQAVDLIVKTLVDPKNLKQFSVQDREEVLDISILRAVNENIGSEVLGKFLDEFEARLLSEKGVGRQGLIDLGKSLGGRVPDDEESGIRRMIRKVTGR